MVLGGVESHHIWGFTYKVADGRIIPITEGRIQWGESQQLNRRHSQRQ